MARCCIKIVGESSPLINYVNIVNTEPGNWGRDQWNTAAAGVNTLDIFVSEANLEILMLHVSRNIENKGLMTMFDMMM